VAAHQPANPDPGLLLQSSRLYPSVILRF